MGAIGYVALAAALLAVSAGRRLDATRLAADVSPKRLAWIAAGRPPVEEAPSLPLPTVFAPGQTGFWRHSTQIYPFTLRGGPLLSRGGPLLAMPPTASSNGDLVHAQAAGQAGELTAVEVPAEWADKLARRDDSGLDLVAQHSAPGVQSYRARLSCDPKFNVVVEALETTGESAARAERELYMHRRLAMLELLPGMGRLSGIVPLVDSIQTPRWTFLMTASDRTLSEHLQDAMQQTAWAAHQAEEAAQEVPLPAEWHDHWTPLLDPDALMAFIIDLLRGLRSLEAAGIAHSKLGMDAVVFRDGRAYISDLGSACLVHDGDADYGCSASAARAGYGGAAADYLKAPEARYGYAPTPATDVWAAGLLISEVAMGLPVTALNDIAAGLLASGGLNERTLRLANNFAIETAENFDKLPAYLRELLEGMLETDPERRWSASRALHHVLDQHPAGPASDVAAETPQPSVALPPEWSDFM